MKHATRSWMKGFALSIIGMTAAWCLMVGVILVALSFLGVHWLAWSSGAIEALVGSSMAITGSYACSRVHKELWVLNLERIDRQLAREDLAEASRNT